MQEEINKDKKNRCGYQLTKDSCSFGRVIKDNNYCNKCKNYISINDLLKRTSSKKIVINKVNESNKQEFLIKQENKQDIVKDIVKKKPTRRTKKMNIENGNQITLDDLINK